MEKVTLFKNFNIPIEDITLSSIIANIKIGIYHKTQKRVGKLKIDKCRNELFWNEILAPDQIDRLLSSKIFINLEAEEICCLWYAIL